MARLGAFVARCLAAVLLCSQAHAAVEILSGPALRAEQGRDFPPIRARMTDASGAPVAGARVHATVPYGMPIAASGGETCYFELGLFCTATTDSAGIAQFPALYGNAVGRYTIAVGGVPLTLIVDPFVDPPTLMAVSATSQRAVTGATFPPFIVRALDAQGRPMVGIEVVFTQNEGASAVFAGSYRYSPASAITDGGGFATAPPLVAGSGLGPGALRAGMFAPGTHYGVGTRFEYTITNARGETELALQDMWWSGFAETGWGVSIAQHGDRLFAVLYFYDAAGRPTWHVLPGGGWGDRFVTFGGFAYAPRGSPYFAYDAARLRVASPSSYMHFTFDGDARARLQLDIGEQRSIKALIRQDFTSGTPAPLRGLGDMWWGGPEQNGWGIALMEQEGGLFSVWLTYDEQGVPTWFVMPAGTWTDASTFEGAIYRTSGPTWPAYDPARLTVTPVGTFRYRFSGRTAATFSWQIESRAGSAAITRQPF